MIEIEQKLRMERESKFDIINSGNSSGRQSIQPENNTDQIKKSKSNQEQSPTELENKQMKDEGDV